MAVSAAMVLSEALALILQAHVGVLLDTAPCLAAGTLYIATGTVMALDFAQMMARVSGHSFQVVARGIRDGVLHLDASGSICFANAATGEIFGVDCECLVGVPFSSLLSAGGDAEDLAIRAASQQGFADAVGRRAGEAVALEVSVSRWPAPSPYRYTLIARDVSARRAEAERQHRIARTDALTGIGNRFALMERLIALTTNSAHAQEGGFALLLFDLDGFKEINDAFGHETGDKSLCQFAGNMRSVVAASDLSARLGGDEFALVLAGDGWRDRLAHIVQSYDDLFAERYLTIGSRRLKLSSSMGSAVFPVDGATAGDLLANADLALYTAKKNRTRTTAFAHEFRQELNRVRAVQEELRRALNHDELVLFYQPQIDLASGRLVGAESLIRWQHPERGLLSPGAFLDAVHASDLTDEVAIHVMRSAFRQAALWQRSGYPVRVGVNLSPSLFLLDLPSLVARELADAGVDPKWIDLEVTENILLHDSNSAAETLGRLRALGVGVAFDDFGTGFASLTHLRSLPIDCLKIDRSFVTDVDKDRPASAIVSAIVQMAEAFDIRVVAEGIENVETARALRFLGCHEGQGYHFGRPEPAENLTRRIAGLLAA